MGFNHISTQTKRYALGSNVRRDEVQNYVGAVAGTPSKKASLLQSRILHKER